MSEFTHKFEREIGKILKDWGETIEQAQNVKQALEDLVEYLQRIEEEKETYTCEVCGTKMDSNYLVSGENKGYGGNCCSCGLVLCGKCAVSWNDHGECKHCDTVHEHGFELVRSINIERMN